VKRARNKQRGAVSVELALGIPLLVMVILGGVHFGLVLATRHELGDATNYATRRAAIAGSTNPNQIRSAIADRLGTSSRCSGLDVTASTTVDGLGVRRVDVVASCTATTGVGGALLPFLGSSEISVRASMPF